MKDFHVFLEGCFFKSSYFDFSWFRAIDVTFFAQIEIYLG